MNIAIIGCGKMGSDIFYYLSEFDFDLIFVCKNDEKRSEVEKKYQKKIERSLKRGLIDNKKYSSLSNNIIIKNFDKLSQCDIVIETITENIDKKRELIKKIVEVTNDNTIIATNSSSFIPSVLTNNSQILKRFCGLHFFYPIKLKNILEFIKPNDFMRENEVIMTNFLSIIERNYLLLNEKQGSILNKILLEFQAVAYNVCIQFNVDYCNIDKIISQEIMPIGVFTFFDAIGLDTVYNSIQEYIKDDDNAQLYIPLSQEIYSKIQQHQYGKKSGKGFYDYDNMPDVNNDIPNKEYIKQILLYSYINAVYKKKDDSNINVDDLDNALREYTNSNKGPITLAKEIGYLDIYNFILDIYNNTMLDIFPPSENLNLS